MDSTDRVLSGRYRLCDHLGSGGMGTVWRAEDLLLGRGVAVKEVRFPPGITAVEADVLRERTRREARAAARLHHPNAVTIFDVVEEDGRPWLVMELVEARTLAEAIADDGPLPPRQVAEVGLAVLSALEAAHRRGIVHRDVKPSNVLLAHDETGQGMGRVVLTDFGIATTVGDASLTGSGLLLGSPGYIAPERARGMAPGPASDLWSLGATLFTAVEGRPPFDGGDALMTVTAVATEEHAPYRAAGPLIAVLDGLLDKDPVERLDAARARSLLQRVRLSDAPTVAVPVGGALTGGTTQALHLDDARREIDGHAAAAGGPAAIGGLAAIGGPAGTGTGDGPAVGGATGSERGADDATGSGTAVGTEAPADHRLPAPPQRPPLLPARQQAGPRRRPGVLVLAGLLCLALLGAGGVALARRGDRPSGTPTSAAGADPGTATPGPAGSAAPAGTAGPSSADSTPTAPAAPGSPPAATSAGPRQSASPGATRAPAATPSAATPSPVATPPSAGPTTSPARSAPAPGPPGRPGASGAPAAGVPAGWTARQGPGGSTAAVPASYAVGAFRGNPEYRDAATGRTLRVESGQGQPDAVVDRRNQARSFAAAHPTYNEIGIRRVGYKGFQAADWEFTYDKLHVLNRVVNVNGRGYSLYFQTGAGDFAAARPVAEAMFAAFSPASP